MATEQDDSDVAPPPKEQRIFSLSIYETLDRTQNSHGVMHEDYHQYHQYCTNRLFRLRHAQPVRRELVHNSKYVEGVQMRRNAYCPRRNKNNTSKQEQTENKGKEGVEEEDEEDTVPAIVEHENHLWVPLYQAERAWAQACEIQKQKRPSKTQQLVLRKLRKAVKFAKALQELCIRTCNEQTQKEIESYLGWMEGNYALQKQDYATALGGYRTSMSTLLLLAQKQKEKEGGHDPQSLVMADLWTTRAESVLRPLVRFCQYECKDTTPDLALESASDTTGSRQTTGKSSEIVVTFRGKTVPLDPYKELCVLYLKAEALLQQQQQQNSQTTSSSNNNDNNNSSSKGGGGGAAGNAAADASFLSLLSIYDDAVAYVETQLAQYRDIQQAGPAVTAKKEELGALVGYFQYQKLQRSLQKNQERLADCHSDVERVHVYDALLQNAQAMAQIGLDNNNETTAGGGGGGGEPDEEAQAHVLRIRALRCCLMAKVYLGTLQQPPQAKALWKQATALTKRAIEELAACDTRDKEHEEEIDKYIEELEEFQKTELAVLEVRIQAASYLRRTGQTAGLFAAGTDRPLWMRLEEFDPGVTGGSIVDAPPRPIPIPAKPVFYDLAWKYAGGNFPMEELDKEIEKRQPKPSGGGGGFFGWLTGSK